MKLRVGARVRVIVAHEDRYGDGDPSKPARRYANKVGTVRRVVLDDPNWPVGETPRDPYYVVAVPHVGTDLFWREELRRVSR